MASNWHAVSPPGAGIADLVEDGQITDLGALGGGAFSFPNAIHNRSQVVGMTRVCGTDASMNSFRRVSNGVIS